MSLFPRFSPSVRGPFENDFRSLFRLIDNVSSKYENSMPTSTSIRAFAPRFDVEEKENAYHLHGELPGIDQKDIDIEFTDAHTLVIKGGTESYVEETHGEPAEAAGKEGDAPKQATNAAQDDKAQSTTELTTTGGDKNQVANVGGSGSKWWVSERSAGEFYRSFSFPSRVDHEGVKASLSKGILSIVVPKAAQKKANKKVTIESDE